MCGTVLDATQKIREIAARENTSERRIRELYFRALAGRALVEERKKGGERRDEGRKGLPMGNRHVLLYSEEVFPAECV